MENAFPKEPARHGRARGRDALRAGLPFDNGGTL